MSESITNGQLLTLQTFNNLMARLEIDPFSVKATFNSVGSLDMAAVTEEGVSSMNKMRELGLLGESTDFVRGNTAEINGKLQEAMAKLPAKRLGSVRG